MNEEKNNLSIEDCIKNILTKNSEHLIMAIADKYFQEENLRKIITEEISIRFKKIILNKIEQVSGFFDSQFEKYFVDNLMPVTNNIIEKRINEDKNFTKKINSYLKKYLKQINFEKITWDFFQSKKDIFMEIFMRSMFLEDKQK